VTAPSYVTRYDPDTDVDRHFTAATAAAIVEHLRPGDRVAELGCATGLMTSMLVAHGAAVTALDRHEEYLARARARGLEAVRWVRAESSELDDGPYDHVVATNVLHEQDDPDAFLADCARLAGPGLVHLAVPNPRSLHRLVAVEMGLIPALTELSDNSRGLGHRGHLFREEVEAMARAQGLRTVAADGVFLKPLPNADLARLDPDVLAGLARAGRHLPDHAAFYYLRLRRDDPS
jgi:2-polyprenyl-3-methyl-5-hydroxy-6-metoxy-1,4-benzoquinol methylase